jgi:hypothetical protein
MTAENTSVGSNFPSAQEKRFFLLYEQISGNIDFHIKPVSGWLLLSANSALFQLYHGENKLIINEMMMMSALH